MTLKEFMQVVEPGEMIEICKSERCFVPERFIVGVDEIPYQNEQIEKIRANGNSYRKVITIYLGR